MGYYLATDSAETDKAWHDKCAHEVFGIDTTKEGYGSWHHSTKGMTWSPWINGLSCETCGKPS
jgi:hypothetical protein